MDRILIYGPDSANKGLIASGMATYKGVEPTGISTITPDPNNDGDDKVYVVYLETEPTEEEVTTIASTINANVLMRVTTPV